MSSITHRLNYALKVITLPEGLSLFGKPANGGGRFFSLRFSSRRLAFVLDANTPPLLQGHESVTQRATLPQQSQVEYKPKEEG